MKKRLIDVGRLRACGLAILLVFLAFPLHVTDVLALDWEFGSGGTIELDTTLSYSAAWRVEDQDTELLDSSGNAEFDKGDMTLSAFKMLVDFDLNWEEKYGVFIRGSALYDTVYEDSKFDDEARDVHGKNAEIQDAFVFGNFAINDYPLTLRAGRQAVFWGESLLILGGIATAMNPLDTTRSNAPGVETKELILPTGQVYGQLSTPDSKLTLATYVKWEWEKSLLDEAGTYFSTNDAIDDAGHFLGPFPRGGDQGQKDGGEYGISLQYLTDNGDEFGLYYLNYRENMPMLLLDLTGPSYYLEYQGHVKLYGATFSTMIGSANVAGEVSYRPNLKLQMAGPLPSYEEGEFLQTQLSAIYTFGALGWIADGGTLLAEWAYNRVLDFDDNELANDKWATGGSFKIAFDYYDVAPGLDLKVPVSFAYNQKGKTSYAISGLTEGSHKVGIGANFTYLGVYQVGLSYTAFLGSADDNNKTDRDNIALNIKYTF